MAESHRHDIAEDGGQLSWETSLGNLSGKPIKESYLSEAPFWETFSGYTAGTCWDLLNLLCLLNLLEPARTCWDLLEPAATCWNLLRPAATCWDLLGPAALAETCWDLL